MILDINNLLTEVLMQITEHRCKFDIDLSSDVLLAELTPAQEQLSTLMSTVSLSIYTFPTKRYMIWSPCYTPIDLIYGLIANHPRGEIPLEHIYSGSLSNNESRNLMSIIVFLSGYRLWISDTNPHDDEWLKILKIETILIFENKSLKIQMLNKGCT